MKKNYLLVMGATMMLAIGMSSCSSNDEEVLNELNATYSGGLGEGSDKGPSYDRGDVNVLRIQSDNGDTETCELIQPNCGYVWEEGKLDEDGSSFNVYHMVFSAIIQKSSLFNILHIDIENSRNIKPGNLRVGDTFDSSVIRFEAWDDSPVNGFVSCHGTPDNALSGIIQVVDQKIYDSGKSYITLSLQDLKFYSYDQKCNYTLNGLVDYEINNYSTNNTNDPNDNTDEEIDMESMLMPSDELILFMMDALYKNGTQGRNTFFTDKAQDEECLIINNETELREAYKGDKALPYVDFQHCSLVIGRTYGESGGVSLGDYDLVDNGDSYQLNLTLNNNINPDYAYTNAFVDLYFWKLYPKMEKKPVVFNRTPQNVDLDPFCEDSAYAKIRNRWLLYMYSDADGNSHEVSPNGWGDERYTIEFKENGKVEGSIGENEYSGNYTMPYACKMCAAGDNRDADIYYGIFNLWDWNITENKDNEPLSQDFMRIFNATEFKLWSTNFLTIRISEKEYFAFFRENLKADYGFARKVK